MYEKLIKHLHSRSDHLKNIFIANIVVAVILFGLLVSSFIFMLSEGYESKYKAFMDYGLSVFFFIAVVLLIISEYFTDIKFKKTFSDTKKFMS